MITIVLADDHPIVRQGIRALLDTQPDYEVVAEVDDGLAAIETVERLKPDVLIVDVMMPGLNGLEVTRRVRERLPQTRVIVLSMHSNEPYVLEALRNGATAYVLKATSTSSLMEAIQAAAAGKRYLSPPLTERAIDAYIQRAKTVSSEWDKADSYEMLTTREREVLQLAAEGLSNIQIGERLTISPRTAETHRTNLMRKLKLRSQTDLVRYSMERGLISK